MTIWLPRWPVQRVLQQQPECRSRPVVLCRQNHRGLLTVTSWGWATPPAGAPERQPRICPGMSLAEAMAVLAASSGPQACRLAHVVDEDCVGDQQALETLARWCRRFSPVVALGPEVGTAGSDSLHLDVTGTAHFFGGESTLARTALWTLAARGLYARVAIADTPTAAWAAARYPERVQHASQAQTAGLPAPAAGQHGRWRHRQQRWVVVPPGQQRQLLGSLPLAALRLATNACETLAEVGVATVGQLLRLSRVSLRQRFEPEVTLRIAHLLGEAAEPLTFPRGDDLPSATEVFDLPVLSRDLVGDAFAQLLRVLVGDCLQPLRVAGRGITSLQVRLDGDGRGPTVIDVGLFRPTVEATHLVDLILLRLERIRLAREITAVTVEVVAVATLPCRQQVLFAGPPTAGAAAVDGLLDRLASRLGRSAVIEPRLVADAQPEAAWAAVPIAGRVGLRQARPQAGGRVALRYRHGQRGAAGGSRPTFLLPRPQPLEVLALAPEGPPLRFRWRGQDHRVDRVRGPERIETAWWRGPTVRRDYYIVETASGGRFWLFRGLRRQSWFLHGTYG